MRIRALKPGFFKNEQLAELSPWHRLCFQGLWCCADRFGRLQDRPKRLKAEIFPYDDLDMNMLLWDLARTGFVVRYQIGAHPYLWIPTWDLHQHPRTDEGPSTFPAYVAGSERQGGPEATTFPAVRPIETGSSLLRDAAETPARMGDGIVGDGRLDMGEASATLAPQAPLHVRAQDLIELWNATTKPPLPRCRELTDERRRKIRARLASRPSLTEWREVFEAVQSIPFYRGENDRQWVADFDYVIKNDTVAAKVLERTQTPRRAAEAPYECTHNHPACENPGNWKCRQRSELDKVKAS